MSILTCGVSSFIGPLHSAEGGIGIERGRVGGVRIGIGVDDPHQGRARVEQEVWRAMLLEPESVAAMSVSKSYDFHQGCQMAKFDPFLSLDCAPTPSTLAQRAKQIRPKKSGYRQLATIIFIPFEDVSPI